MSKRTSLSHSSLYLLVLIFVSCSSPKPLVYSDIKNFHVEKLGFENSELRMDLEYYNPNNFGLQLKNSELDLYVNNSFLGHSVSDSLISIPRQDTFLMPIKFSLDMRNLFKNAWNTFTNNEVSIKVNGKIRLGKANVFMNMPINYEGKHKFSLY